MNINKNSERKESAMAFVLGNCKAKFSTNLNKVDIQYQTKMKDNLPRCLKAK